MMARVLPRDAIGARARGFLLFLVFLVLTQLFSTALEWLLIERLRVVATAGRPWRPEFFYVWDGAGIAGGLVAALIVARLGPRGWSRLGFDTNRAPRQLMTGMVVGLMIIAVLVCEIAAFGGFATGPLAMTRVATFVYGLSWLLALGATAFAGEIVLHGPALFTLSDAIGFWPAAATISMLIAALGLGSGGAGLNFAAASNTLLAGLFFCFAVRRTGAIWFSVGLHAAMDYASLYIAGSPSRGNQGGEPIETRLFLTNFHGPHWITGGTVGIQSSWLLLPVIGAAFATYAFVAGRSDGIRRGAPGSDVLPTRAPTRQRA